MPKKTPGILFQVLLMSSGTTSHPLPTMPKNWDMYKNEIEDRYMKRGQTLLSVKNFIKEKYGFEASLVKLIKSVSNLFSSNERTELERTE
jgi:hypothetical protein